MDWNSIKATLIRWMRIILRRYQAEIKKYVAEQVDAQIILLDVAIHDAVRARIKNEIVATAIEHQLDIYTSAGAETVKVLVNRYVDSLIESGE